MSRTFTQRDLPHYKPNDAPYFITFNLHGAIPESKREVYRQTFQQYDNLLHELHGEQWLRDVRLAEVVYEKLMWLTSEVADMYCFTIMSNHVHLMMSLHQEQDLSDLLRLLKGNTARKCNLLLGRTGTFWQDERFDRVVRRKEHWPIIHYILNNPVRAGLVKHWRDYRWTYLNPGLFPMFEMDQPQVESELGLIVRRGDSTLRSEEAS
jgi:putative transposase